MAKIRGIIRRCAKKSVALLLSKIGTFRNLVISVALFLSPLEIQNLCSKDKVMKKIPPFKIIALSGIALLGFALTPSKAHATPVTYVLTGTGGSGTFNGTAFSGQTFTLTGIGDTTSTTTVAGFPAISLSSMTYQIGANPLATTTSPFFMVNVNSAVPDELGFVNSTGVQSTAFTAGAGSWGMITNYAASATFFGQNGISTNQGSVVLSGWTNATFTATVGATAAPEPTTLSLLGLGMLGSALVRKQKRKGENA
jgi:hypothetical protein